MDYSWSTYSISALCPHISLVFKMFHSLGNQHGCTALAKLKQWCEETTRWRCWAATVKVSQVGPPGGTQWNNFSGAGSNPEDWFKMQIPSAHLQSRLGRPGIGPENLDFNTPPSPESDVGGPMHHPLRNSDVNGNWHHRPIWECLGKGHINWGKNRVKPSPEKCHEARAHLRRKS